MFNIELSVSKETPISKKDAQDITKFEIREFPVTVQNNEQLRTILQNNNYSTNQWKNGHCKNENFIRMSGVTLDVDNGLTLEEAKEKFKAYNYVIHTSTSHRADIPKKGGVKDRFRVILPFSPANYAVVNSAELAYAVYDYLITVYPFVDQACREPARKYYPYLNHSIPELFEFYVNDVGNFFHVDLDQIMAIRANMRNNGIAQKSSIRHDLKLDDVFTMADGGTIKVRDVKFKVRVLCPYHNDTASSAFLEKHPNQQQYFHCKACDMTNWVPIIDHYPDLFYVNNRLCKISVREGQGVQLGEAPASYLNNLDTQTIKDLTHSLAVNRWYAGEQIQLIHTVNPDTDKTYYEFHERTGIIKTFNAAIATNKKDNDFVDKWIDDYFRKSLKRYNLDEQENEYSADITLTIPVMDEEGRGFSLNDFMNKFRRYLSNDLKIEHQYKLKGLGEAWILIGKTAPIKKEAPKK